MLLSAFALKYDDYAWEIIEDFKMVTFLLGLQRWFHHTSLFSLPLEQLGLQSALLQKVLATAH